MPPEPPASNVRSFGELLGAYRRAAGLTQEELAGRAGLSSDAVSLLERGQRTSPRTSTVALLARALRLSPDEQAVLEAAARRRPTRPAAALRVPPDLRMPQTPFIGREDVLARALAVLARPGVRQVTLTGAPGAGKTRLALELAAVVAGRYRDGVVAVTLAPLADAGLVLPAIRQALGLREAASEPALDTIAAHCAVRQLLLVLDNFEHVAPAAPEVVELLARCPEVQVVATSRASLRVRGERELEVPPLRLPTGEEAGDLAALRAVASVGLFVERAAAAAPGFELTAENAAAVAAVCRRLDGLPLALELAAPWVRLLPPRELLARLDRRLELLVDGPRDLPPRQRTLRAALRWSCQLLDPEGQAVLRRLSVFAGSAPLEALEVVCQAAGPLPGGALRGLAALVDHGLVRRLADDRLEPRVTVLETVREFSRELLEEAGELAVTAGAHLDWCARLAAEAGPALAGVEQAAWLDRLTRELDSMRAALRWAAEHGSAATGLRLAAALHDFWLDRGHTREGLAVLERLLRTRTDRAVDPALMAAALRTAGTLAWRLGANDQAAARFRESVAIARELGDVRGLAEGLRGLAPALERLGEHEESLALFEEAVALLRGMDDPPELAAALMHLGVAVMRDGHAARATALYEEALALFRRQDNSLGVAMCLINLGNQTRHSGDPALAGARIEEAAAIARRLDAPFHLAAALEGLSSVAWAEGDVAASGRYGRESLRVFSGVGQGQGVAVALRALARVAWAEGRPVRAARLYGAAQASCPIELAPDKDEQPNHAPVLQALREELGEEGFAAAREAGGRLSLEQATAEAQVG